MNFNENVPMSLSEFIQSIIKEIEELKFSLMYEVKDKIDSNNFEI